MLNCTYTKYSVEVFWSLRINVTTYFYVKIVLRILSTYGLKRGKTQLEILGIVSNYTTGNGRFSGKSGQGFFVPLKRSFPLKQSLPVLNFYAVVPRIEIPRGLPALVLWWLDERHFKNCHGLHYMVKLHWYETDEEFGEPNERIRHWFYWAI